MTEKPTDLTPVHERNGRWYKREDLFRLPNGVNGSKLRACHHLVAMAQLDGAETVISAASVLSPQSPMTATVAAKFGMKSITIVGGTTPEKAARHRTIQMAMDQGSEVQAIAVGYNPALQSAGRRLAEELPGAWQMPYGITTTPNSSLRDVRDFVEVGAAQVQNLPDDVETIVLPFGSGNTAMGVLYGLLTHGAPRDLKKIVLMTIGPDRRPWLETRMSMLGQDLSRLPIEQIHLHPTFATYGDKMPETLDDIVLHPTYEGKVARYLNGIEPRWWDRGANALLWIVGGPLP